VRPIGRAPAIVIVALGCGVSLSDDLAEHPDRIRVERLCFGGAVLVLALVNAAHVLLDHAGSFRIEQTKLKVFERYDAMAKATESTQGTQPNPHFEPAFARASKGEAAARQELARAQQAVTLAAAKQSRAGNNVYASSTANQERQAADKALERAQAAIDRAGGTKERARGQLYSVTVDLAPIASTMRRPAADRFRWAGYNEQRNVLRPVALAYRRAYRAGASEGECCDAALREYRRVWHGPDA
jgi:hypothetical protein